MSTALWHIQTNRTTSWRFTLKLDEYKLYVRTKQHSTILYNLNDPSHEG